MLTKNDPFWRYINTSAQRIAEIVKATDEPRHNIDVRNIRMFLGKEDYADHVTEEDKEAFQKAFVADLLKALETTA